MPVTRIGVQAVTGSPGQIVDIDPARITATITNAGSVAVEYSTGGAWTSIAAGGSASVSCDTHDLRLRRGVSGAYPAPVDIDWTATSEGEATSLTEAQARAVQALVSADGKTRDAGTRIGVDGFRVALDYIDTPTEIANCELWLDASSAEKSDGSPCVLDGDTVATLRDGSGNGRHATGTATYSAAGGKAGRSGWLGKLNTSGFLTAAMGQACTIVTVTADGMPGAWKCKVSSSVGLYVTRNGGTGFKDWTATGVTGLTGTTEPFTTGGGVEVFGWDATAGQSVQIMDGWGRSSRTNEVALRQASGVGGGIAWTGSQTLTVGGFAGTTTDNWISPMSEVIMYSRLLTNAELLRLMAYLNAKYADRPMVRMVGNSIATGDDTLLSSSGTFLGGLMYAALAGRADFRLDAYPGRSSAQILSESPAYSAILDAGKAKRVTIVWELTNALNAYNSPAAAYQEAVRICKRYRDTGAYVIVPTCLYRADGTLSVFQQRADKLNAMLAANWRTFADGFVDLLADTRLRNPNDTTYFKTDKIHPNPAGAAVVRDLLMPEVTRLLAL